MNRSVYMITLLAGFGATGFVGCSDTETWVSGRSGSQESGNVLDLNAGTNSSDSEQSAQGCDSEQSADGFEGSGILVEDPDTAVDGGPELTLQSDEAESGISQRCKNQDLTNNDAEQKSSDVSDDKATGTRSCQDIEDACAEIYAPVVCEGSASPFDGREIALIIGPFKGGNECEVRSRMFAVACSYEAKLSPEISCKSLDTDIRGL